MDEFAALPAWRLLACPYSRVIERVAIRCFVGRRSCGAQAIQLVRHNLLGATCWRLGASTWLGQRADIAVSQSNTEQVALITNARAPEGRPLSVHRPSAFRDLLLQSLIHSRLRLDSLRQNPSCRSLGDECLETGARFIAAARCADGLRGQLLYLTGDRSDVQLTEQPLDAGLRHGTRLQQLLCAAFNRRVQISFIDCLMNDAEGKRFGRVDNGTGQSEPLRLSHTDCIDQVGANDGRKNAELGFTDA